MDSQTHSRKNHPAATGLSSLGQGDDCAHSGTASAQHARMGEKAATAVEAWQLQRVGGQTGIRWESLNPIAGKAAHELQRQHQHHVDASGSRRRTSAKVSRLTTPPIRNIVRTRRRGADRRLVGKACSSGATLDAGTDSRDPRGDARPGRGSCAVARGFLAISPLPRRRRLSGTHRAPVGLRGLGPDLGPVFGPQVFAGHGAGCGALDGYASLQGHGALTVAPLRHRRIRDRKQSRQLSYATNYFARSQHCTHAEIVRHCLPSVKALPYRGVLLIVRRCLKL